MACDRVLAETNGTGSAGTTREYIWLGDLPVAVIDKSVTPNKTYWVHADHLNRPYFMTDAARAVVWKAIYEPFGTVYSTTGTAAQTQRFPGQWFQIESNLAYNWHRHYDATTGRYIFADPLNHALNGAPVTATTLRGGSVAPYAANLNWLSQRWLPDATGSGALNAVNAGQSLRTAGLFPDGPNIYNYARQAPGKNTDPTGLVTTLLHPLGSRGDCDVKKPDHVQLAAKKRSPTYYCQNVVCGAPHGGLYEPLCPSCAEKNRKGLKILLENNEILHPPEPPDKK